jgi:hypothetical protein
MNNSPSKSNEASTAIEIGDLTNGALTFGE